MPVYGRRSMPCQLRRRREGLERSPAIAALSGVAEAAYRARSFRRDTQDRAVPSEGVSPLGGRVAVRAPDTVETAGHPRRADRVEAAYDYPGPTLSALARRSPSLGVSPARRARSWLYRRSSSIMSLSPRTLATRTSVNHIRIFTCRFRLFPCTRPGCGPGATAARSNPARAAR